MRWKPSPRFEKYRRDRDVIEHGFGHALRKAGIEPACRAGCSHCCRHDGPTVTPGEAAALVELVDHTPTLAVVWKRMRDQYARANLLARAALARGEPPVVLGQYAYSGEFPCVFLEGDRCSIYRFRPIECVTGYSRSEADCASSTTQDATALAAGEADFPWGRKPPDEQARLESALSAAAPLAAATWLARADALLNPGAAPKRLLEALPLVAGRLIITGNTASVRVDD